MKLVSNALRKQTFRLLATLLLIFYVCSSLLQAQKETHLWYFGYMSGLDFSNGSPVLINDSAMDAFEGCASMSDADGNLLFYTNGGGFIPNSTNGERTGYIWNRNHEILYDMGQTEGGGYSAAQSSLILPKPNVPDIYYLFTMDHQPSLFNPSDNRGLSYFEIDMTLNGGLGGVTLADERIYTPCTESLTAFAHADQEGYWLVSIDRNTEEFVLVEVNETGIQEPIFQARQTTIEVSPIKSSANGKFLCDSGNIYLFDNNTGQLTFLTNLPGISNYTFTFSPESKYLYALETIAGGDLMRFDLNAADINQSKEVLATFEETFSGLMQIAPDGNIYMMDLTFDQIFNNMNGISVIRCPDTPTPTVERGIFEVPTEADIGLIVGLPNFPDFLFDNSETPIEMSIDTVKSCFETPETLNAGVSGATYQWSTGETIPMIEVTSAGDYSVTVSNACGLDIAIANFLLIAETEANDTQDTLQFSICPDETIALSTSIVGTSYLWSNGETAPQITVTEPNQYQVEIQTACATYLEIFEVSVSPLPTVSIQPNPITAICEGDIVQLEAEISNASNIVWSTGSTNVSTTVQMPGDYFVTASNTCGEAVAETTLSSSEACCTVYIPNVFSPNDDGANDRFLPIFGGCDLQAYRLSIYSRWGALVFDSQNIDIGWDGIFKGKRMEAGVFVWQLSYQISIDGETHLESGDVLLLR